MKKHKEKKSEPLAGHLSYRLREAMFIIVSALSLFLLMALISYHRTDPGWSNTGVVNHVANISGRAGAWFSDVFLLVFGYIAYLLPLMLPYGAGLFLRKLPEESGFDSRVFALRASGFIFIIAAGCALASLQVIPDHALLPFSAGGILGNIIGFGLASELNVAGATLILLALFCGGITLFTGLSWLWLIDTFGRFTFTLCDKINVQLVHVRHRIKIMMAKRRAEKEKRSEPKFEPLKIEIKKPEARKFLSKSQRQPRIHIQDNKIKIVPSNRAQKDRQLPLFDLPVEGTLPSLSLLEVPKQEEKRGFSTERLEQMSREVEFRLKDFNIEVQVVAVHPGPVITRFEMQLAAGIKVSRISALAKDLARSLSVVSVRIVEVIPGKSVVGLELPNEDRETVRLSEILSSQQYDQIKSPLALALGKDIAGNPVIVDLGKMPHLLVAGTTGSGKSVGVNAMLMGLLYKSTPAEVRMILVDPKMLELSVYEGIPHLLTPVVTDMKEAANALRWCVAEMERRYRLMASMGVRNLAGFNKKVNDAIKNKAPISDPLWKDQGVPGEECPTLQSLPFIVVVIDEYADMMMVVGKKVEQLIARIAQKARAAGIHLILATQRPSVDVITGLIKANIPSRIAYQVSSKIDSRTVLDQSGAEQLLGHGDMLYLPPGTSIPVRIHGAFVADEEVHRVAEDWKKRGDPQYIEEIVAGSGDGADGEEGGANSDGEKDELYDQAVYIVTKTRRASISSIQRRLKIGYNRAARLVEEMENAGVVTPMESNGSREVLAPPPVEG